MAIGKITPIKIEPSQGIKTMSNSLAAIGKNRYPGCGIVFYPKRLITGKFQTGLDEESREILSIQDPKERKAEQKRITEKRKRLEDYTGLDLSPRSSYWNYALYTDMDPAHVQPITLMDKANVFDLSNPYAELAFTWLKECDLIAPSYEAYLRGDKGPSVLFYVDDEEVENNRAFQRKQRINKAIIANDTLSPDKRKKIAILMGLGITDNTPEQTVYNIIDDSLKETEFKSGKYKGLSPVNKFMEFVELDNKFLNAKFLVDESIRFNIYRERADGLYEGERKVFNSATELVNNLCSDDYQEQLIALERRVKSKKIA